MNKDRIEGATTNTVGKIEKTIGDMTGDAGLQFDGLIDQAKGKAQNLFGNAKDAVDAALEEEPLLVPLRNVMIISGLGH